MMKVCVIQPEYQLDFAESDRLFAWELEALDRCDETLDLIVLPESADTPALASTAQERARAYEKYNAPLLEKAAQTAKRCGAVLFVNARDQSENGLRNTTFAFDRQGRLAGKYFKQHLTPGETEYLDCAYTFRYEPPTVVEIDGVRYGFLTCYDFYFYEAFSALARCRPDVIIGCSHQRSDTHKALEMMSRFCAYNTNAYVVRASVSLGADSPVGGSSMVVSPDGTVLLDLENRVGAGTVEIDPAKKYYKPGGFGNPVCAHFEYVEKGRRPWKYRPAGPGIVLPDDRMPYPRVCAHRGFNTVAPENSMPAFGAAVAAGAQEIEFDLWQTTDGEIVSIHDSHLDRVSNGTGRVWEHSLAELKALDFGSKFRPEFTGLTLPTFEEILRAFACRVVMNIHVKSIKECPTGVPEGELKKIIALVRQYDCEKYIYFMSGDDRVLEQLQRLAPDLSRCCGGGDAPYQEVERALRYGCNKIQLFTHHYTPDMITRAHENGLRVTAFYADTPEKAKEYLAQGVDTILTNDYLRIARVVREETERLGHEG